MMERSALTIKNINNFKWMKKTYNKSCICSYWCL